MDLSVHTGLRAMRTRFQMQRSQQARSQAFERLSSGRRLNRAADDAGSMAIRNRMSSRVRSYQTAIRNASQGESLVRSASAALMEASDLLVRLKHFAVQASNDTLTLADHKSVQDEVEQILMEFDRLVDLRQYNGMRLVDGSFSSKEIQVGVEAHETIEVSIGAFGSRVLGQQAAAEGTGDGTALGGSGVRLNGTTVGESLAEDDSLSTADAGASAIAKAAAVNRTSGKHGVTAHVGSTQHAGLGAVVAGDLADGDLIINGISVGDVSGVAADDRGNHLAAAINAQTAQTGVTATVDGGALALEAADGRNIEIAVTANGAAVTQLAAGVGTTVTYGELKLTSTADFEVAGSDAAARLGVATGTYRLDRTSVVAGIDMTSKAGAHEAFAVLDIAIHQVAEQQRHLGAVVNRFETTISRLQSAYNGLAASRSRIDDADFAQETASLARAQIAQEAGLALVAQANSAPEHVLALLPSG